MLLHGLHCILYLNSYQPTMFMIVQIPYFILPFIFQDFGHGLVICIRSVEMKKEYVKWNLTQKNLLSMYPHVVYRIQPKGHNDRNEVGLYIQGTKSESQLQFLV